MSSQKWLERIITTKIEATHSDDIKQSEYPWQLIILISHTSQSVVLLFGCSDFVFPRKKNGNGGREREIENEIKRFGKVQ